MQIHLLFFVLLWDISMKSITSVLVTFYSLIRAESTNLDYLEFLQKRITIFNYFVYYQAK